MSCDEFKKSNKLAEALLAKYQPTGHERGGLILSSGEPHEFPNISSEPEKIFVPDLSTVVDVLPQAVGTWHTHPGASANLSTEDEATFKSWPTFAHAIIGENGIRWYAVAGGLVVNA